MLADLDGCPVVRQELVQFLDGMAGDAVEHIAEPGERIDFVQFARRDKAAQDGHSFPAAITTEEGPVVSPYGCGEFIVHLIFKCLKTWTFASRNSADTNDLFVRSPWWRAHLADRSLGFDTEHRERPDRQRGCLV